MIGGVTPLYRAGRQLTKVRAIMLLSLACAALALWSGIALVQVLGIAFLASMWIYGCCYVAAIDFDPETQQLQLHTVRFWGTARQTIEVGGVGASRWHDGQLQGHISVNAPWISVRPAGHRLPLLIDAQGVVLDRRLMKKYFGWSRSEGS
jgi:hypothetical protein